mmetsp:Transcript_32933/g.70092  ORF Transcript_32933/g.70092 Transcript_32933/m.70092 type:complete len:230 (-) Transcript_32933:124-813(-)
MEEDDGSSGFVHAVGGVCQLRGYQHHGYRLPCHNDRAFQDHPYHRGALCRAVRPFAHCGHAAGPPGGGRSVLPLPGAPPQEADSHEALVVYTRDGFDSGPRALRLPLHRDVLHPVRCLESQQDLLRLRLHAGHSIATLLGNRVRQYHLHLRAPECRGLPMAVAVLPVLWRYIGVRLRLHHSLLLQLDADVRIPADRILLRDLAQLLHWSRIILWLFGIPRCIEVRLPNL